MDAVCPGGRLGDAAAGARAARRGGAGADSAGLERIRRTACSRRRRRPGARSWRAARASLSRTLCGSARLPPRAGSPSPTTSFTARPALPWGTRSRYRDFYLRDGARVVRALDLLDRADLAAEGIDQLYEFQWPTGPFLSQGARAARRDRARHSGRSTSTWHSPATRPSSTVTRRGRPSGRGVDCLDARGDPVARRARRRTHAVFRPTR